MLAGKHVKQVHLKQLTELLTGPCAQVLTVHSPFRIENCTNTPLEFVVHMFMAANDNMPMHGNAASTRVPSSGPLLPGLQCYLPAPAIWCASTSCGQALHLVDVCISSQFESL